MTKKKASEASKGEAKQEKQQMYVFLKRTHYKMFVEGESEYIDPVEDPYAPDAPRRAFEHLGQADINRLLMRGVIAPDKE